MYLHFLIDNSKCLSNDSISIYTKLFVLIFYYSICNQMYTSKLHKLLWLAGYIWLGWKFCHLQRSVNSTLKPLLQKYWQLFSEVRSMWVATLKLGYSRARKKAFHCHRCLLQPHPRGSLARRSCAAYVRDIVHILLPL